MWMRNKTGTADDRKTLSESPVMDVAAVLARLVRRRSNTKPPTTAMSSSGMQTFLVAQQGLEVTSRDTRTPPPTHQPARNGTHISSVA